MPEYIDLIEQRFTRKSFESVLMVRDGNRVTAIFSNGLERRKEEWDFNSVPDATEYYDECSVKMMLDGFTKNA